MTSRIWIRCFIVSAVIATVAPALSMTLAAPGHEAQVVDVGAMEVQHLSEGSKSTFNDYGQKAPTRTVNGFFDRFVYVFSHPQIAGFYLKASLAWFIGLFMATTLVGYLGARDVGMGRPGQPADARASRG